MSEVSFSFSAELWEYPSDVAWFFATVPESESSDIRQIAGLKGSKRGFGSVRVEAQLGEQTWKTSVFPDKNTGCYFLPVKKAVRAAEGLAPGDTLALTLTLIESV